MFSSAALSFNGGTWLLRYRGEISSKCRISPGAGVELSLASTGRPQTVSGVRSRAVQR